MEIRGTGFYMPGAPTNNATAITAVTALTLTAKKSSNSLIFF